METILYIFGEGRSLNALQMSARAVIVFFIAVTFLRISGKRTVGLKMPLDYVVIILMGAILGRAINGASPFFPTLAAGLTLAVLHRISGWAAVKSRTWGKFVKGREKKVYENGKFLEKNMIAAMVTKRDLLASMRENLHTEDFDDVDSIYVERTGRISVTRQKKKI